MTTTTGPDRTHPAATPPLVTTCGRRIEVRCLRLALPQRPVERVTLDVGHYLPGEHGTWAALTPDEARTLARLLLAHADRAEPETATEDGTTGAVEYP